MQRQRLMFISPGPQLRVLFNLFVIVESFLVYLGTYFLTHCLDRTE